MDFDDQGQDQEFSLGDPTDENGLDEDGNGRVRESLPTVTEDGSIPGPVEGQYDGGGTSPPATVPAVTDLPDIGGPNAAALALPSLALLVAGGIFAARIVGE